MLTSMKAVLEWAEAKKIAIGAFNITSLEGIQAALGAAEELGQPIILQYAPIHGSVIPLSVIGRIMVMMAEHAAIPVCVHLDHGEGLAVLRESLELGFTSVMYDGSALSFEENVANTNIAMELARAYGASVEAEIGAMGRQEFASIAAAMEKQPGPRDGADCEGEAMAGGGIACEGEAMAGNGVACEGETVTGSYTDPAQAGRFVSLTGIDALACSFGTVHGLYMAAPNLDFGRISRIREQIGIPIVMHGGSGICDEDFGRCIRAGVRKINYYTYLAKAGGMWVKEQCVATKGNVYFHDVSLWGIEAMKQDVRHAIRVFSNLTD